MKENSIEEDIKSINKGLYELEDSYELHQARWAKRIFENIKEKLDHILSDYKRVLNELNKQRTTINKYAKENEELREKWDKDTHILQNELDLTNADKINNYIPIQKVKDNLIKYQEEYELLLEHQSGKESNRTKYLRGRIHMCQELLEGRK